MKLLLLEPFFGGSHKEFALGLKQHSCHDIEIVSLAARFWKWRMGGAALAFHRLVPSLKPYDGIIATDLMSLTDFIALKSTGIPPVLFYFHENQFTYPMKPGEPIDYLFGFNNILSALSATRVAFNSRFHFNEFINTAGQVAGRMPDYRPGWAIEAIQSKTIILYPGCRFPSRSLDLPEYDHALPPLIIWNHRWEFDKNPDDFFNALDALKTEGVFFRLALLGQGFSRVPQVFLEAKKRFKNELHTYGYLPSRDAYLDVLKQGAVVVSTAIQENFGMSVIEAIRMGCLPLLPDRLSYPEILPGEFHDDFLYTDQVSLISKLKALLKRVDALGPARRVLSETMASFAWESIIKKYDQVLENMINAEM